MPSISLLVLGGVVMVALIVWTLLSQRTRNQAHKAAVEQLGFRPCPERRAWLEETVTRIDNDQGSRYDVQDPKRLTGNSEVYLYVKRRHRDSDDSPFATEEILFPLKRPSRGGLVLTVKPSSLAHGLATRMIGAVAAGSWDTQPECRDGWCSVSRTGTEIPFRVDELVARIRSLP